MAWNSGFWNALNTDAGYDRKYNGDNYSEALSFVVGDGVIKTQSGTSMQVLTDNGTYTKTLAAGASTYNLVIKSGWAWITGKWCKNDTDDNSTFVNLSVPTSGRKRYDRVVLRRNKLTSGDNNRWIYPTIITGTQGTTVDPDDNVINNPNSDATITTDSYFYDICIADVLIDNTTGTPIVTVTDMRNSNLCGWVNGYFGDDYSAFTNSLESVFNNWFNQVKNDLATVTITEPIIQRNVLTSATNTVNITLSQYSNDGTGYLQIYTNGLLEIPDVDYTVSGTTITFTYNKTAGTEIAIYYFINVDGTGLNTALDRITALENEVDNIETTDEYNYHCTGYNDNVTLSNKVLTFLGGIVGGDYATLKINVLGDFGANTPYLGQGTSTSPYVIFKFGETSSASNYLTNNRRVILNFDNCSSIDVSFTNDKYYTLFEGYNIEVEGMTLIAGEMSSSQSGVSVTGISSASLGDVKFRRCRMWITGNSGMTFASNGLFDECRITCLSTGTNSLIFSCSNTGEIIINGGKYYSWSGSSTSVAAIVYHGSSVPNAATILNSVTCPIYARSGLYQSDAIKINSGYCNCYSLVAPSTGWTNAVISSTTASTVNVSGTIPLNK